MKFTNVLSYTLFLIVLLSALSYNRIDHKYGKNRVIKKKSISVAQDDQTIPQIIGIRLKGKKLTVTGESFDKGAVLLVNGVAQKTKNTSTSPSTSLVAKKGGLGLIAEQIATLQIQNSNGTLSQEVAFYTGCGSR